MLFSQPGRFFDPTLEVFFQLFNGTDHTSYVNLAETSRLITSLTICLHKKFDQIHNLGVPITQRSLKIVLPKTS